MKLSTAITKPVRAFGSVNLRSRAIQLGLEYVSRLHEDEPLHVFEVGSMYNEEQGLSTYVIADFIARRRHGGRFVSIEWDQGHLDAARDILRRRDPALERWVEQRRGHSLAVLPDVLAGLDRVHLAFLDGGEHPEVCLAEFEQTLQHLVPHGVVIIDDAQSIEPDDQYGLPRPMGKLTLVLPKLVIENYLAHRAEVRASGSHPDDASTVPDAAFVRRLADAGLAVESGATFCVMGTWHRMLAYGDPAFVAKARWLSDVGLIRRVAGRVLGRFGLLR